MIWGETLMKGKWENHTSHLVAGIPLIEQLLPEKQLMMIAGQFGVGKTMELLHLMCCFSYGSRWHGLRVKPCVPIYITWEGTPEGIDKRKKIIETQYESLGLKFPWYIRMQPKKISLNTPTGRDMLRNIVSELSPKPNVILLDPFKRTVQGNYSNPVVADDWIESANSLAQEIGAAIITSNHTNKVIYRKDSPPDTLGSDKVKGAQDLLDGVAASILIAEEKGYKRVSREDGYAKTQWAHFSTIIKVLKAREATMEFPLLEVEFNRTLLRLFGEKWKVGVTAITKEKE